MESDYLIIDIAIKAFAAGFITATVIDIIIATADIKKKINDLKKENEENERRKERC